MSLIQIQMNRRFFFARESYRIIKSLLTIIFMVPYRYTLLIRFGRPESPEAEHLSQLLLLLFSKNRCCLKRFHKNYLQFEVSRYSTEPYEVGKIIARWRYSTFIIWLVK